MSNEEDEDQPITIYTPTGTDVGDPLWDPAVFNHLWRVAKMFAASALVPEALRGNPQNCFLALSMAKRSGQEPLSVMQSIHFVKGKAGWNSTYLIARAKLAGMPIRWEIDRLPGDLKADYWEGRNNKGPRPIVNMAVTGWAMVDGERVETTITTTNAIGEGWNSNPKYFTMLETMLQYRTATRLVRLYMPEIMLGLPPAEELEVLAPVRIEPVVAEARKALDAASALRVIEQKPPTKEPEPAKPKATAKPKPKPVDDEKPKGMP